MNRKNFSILGTFIKKKRLEAGLSQGDLSRELGYSNPQPISNCERGLSALPLSKLRKIMPLLDVTAEEMTEVLLDQQRLFYLQNFRKSSVGPGSLGRPAPGAATSRRRKVR